MASPVPNSEATQFKTGEKQVEIARRGGIASGEAKREKATMRKTLESMLDEVAKIKNNPNGLTYRQLATLGLIKGAADGKAENFKVITDTIGETTAENTTPEININIIDNSTLEKALYDEEN